jgi:hypothetical protein
VVTSGTAKGFIGRAAKTTGGRRRSQKAGSSGDRKPNGGRIHVEEAADFFQHCQDLVALTVAESENSGILQGTLGDVHESCFICFPRRRNPSTGEWDTAAAYHCTLSLHAQAVSHGWVSDYCARKWGGILPKTASKKELDILRGIHKSMGYLVESCESTTEADEPPPAIEESPMRI